MAKKAAPKKKTTAKRSTKASEVQSFTIVKDTQPFLTFKITRQTVYWTLLVLVIVVLQLWILKLQLDISNITDAMTATASDL